MIPYVGQLVIWKDEKDKCIGVITAVKRQTSSYWLRIHWQDGKCTRLVDSQDDRLTILED